jgi:hypothetical protein
VGVPRGACSLGCRTATSRWSEGIDYDGHSVASPVARTESFFVLFSLVAQFKLHTCLIDISKAFFHGDIGDKNVFVIAPSRVPQGRLCRVRC